jgi:hypothetical protein
MIRSLSLRITLVKPPHGVTLCLQQGKDDLVPPSVSSGEQVSFDFSVNIANDRTAGPPNFRGPEDEAFGLDASNVVIENVPLVVSPLGNAPLHRES